MKGQCCHSAAASAKRAALRWHRGRGGLRADAEGRRETGCWRGRVADCRLLAAGGGLLTEAANRRATGGWRGWSAGCRLRATGCWRGRAAACRRPAGSNRWAAAGAGLQPTAATAWGQTGGAASVVLGPAAAAVLAPTALWNTWHRRMTLWMGHTSHGGVSLVFESCVCQGLSAGKFWAKKRYKWV